MTEPEESALQRRRKRWRPESRARTERVLGLLGLFALGTAAGLAVGGIILIALAGNGNTVAKDSFTALSTIAATAVGGLVGWFSRSFTSPPPPDPPLDHTEGVEKFDPTKLDSE